MPGFRILHTADSHIGAGLPRRPRHRRPRRGDDFITSYRRVLSRALEFDVDLVIHAGDLFDSPRPCSGAVTAVAEPLLEIAGAGIPVVIVPGNHERSAMPESVFLSHPCIHVFGVPQTKRFRLRGGTVAVSAFPALGRQAGLKFAKVLAASGWREVGADHHILAVHEAFAGARCGPRSFRFRSGDDVVSRHEVPRGFDYVAAGHVHRHQCLMSADGTPICYCGSVDRVTFAEIGETKGCVIIEERCGHLDRTFVDHAVRPMRICPFDVSGLTRTQVLAGVSELVSALPDRAVAQVRLTGTAQRGVLRGLQLSAVARRLRPDALISVSSRAVEVGGNGHAPHRGAAGQSAFSLLRAPPVRLQIATSHSSALLPNRRGVYACYDRRGQLLYVGKAADVRARVRAHLRGASAGAYFDGWARHIDRVEVRQADSDLEAMLIEAELIRALRPPFNVQMRRWRRYCYLVANPARHGELEVTRKPAVRAHCYGPFRSAAAARLLVAALAAHFKVAHCPEPESADRPSLFAGDPALALCHRFHDGLCCGPCADRVSEADYAARLRLRDDLLNGRDDATLRALEHDLERRDPDAPDLQDLRRQASVLRSAFDHGRKLLQAELLCGGVLLLPLAPGRRRVVIPGTAGFLFDQLAREAQDAERLLERLPRGVGAAGGAPAWRLPRMVMDGFLIAGRLLESHAGTYDFVAREELSRMEPEQLLQRAFGGASRS